jgi:hypothetical protein
MITTPNIPYYDWIASITNNGTSYPTSFTSTQLDQYNQFLADAVNPQSGDSLSAKLQTLVCPQYQCLVLLVLHHVQHINDMKNIKIIFVILVLVGDNTNKDRYFVISHYSQDDFGLVPHYAWPTFVGDNTNKGAKLLCGF